MLILVTGSSGRVGRAAVAALRAAGYRVRGFDLRASGADLDEVVGSFDDAEACARAVAGTEAVLHLGAFMSWVAAERTAMFRANVEGTRVLLDAAAQAGVRRFVFASSGEVYPENAPLFLPVTEEHPLRANSPYGLTKLLGEDLVSFHQRIGSFETVILRFSHTQDASELLDPDSFFSGPRFFLQPRIRQQERMGNTAVAELLRAADPGRPAHVLARNAAGKPFRMHITDTRDMVKGLLLALESDRAAGGIFNLGATDPVDFAQALPAMSEITGLPVVTVDLPGAGVDYQTSNARIRETLGFEPEWTIDRMLQEAARTWRTRAQA
ncbi:NAD(P)-dependent oxidoreductase [Stappia sp. 28M-7]|uniref:NAD-dependent epimerase/dehydratase family protein n=1 Tax=Stappia sp. 28M-7 TaxID=2762596 RepID=UPI00163CCBA4|nr:NAD(P)-dependent oxidoreductase [Stappia sp. 28M-7]MBC2858562.1 NAD(P)-dependent oxidoreductase [Stappia sp. 28M-7]